MNEEIEDKLIKIIVGYHNSAVEAVAGTRTLYPSIVETFIVEYYKGE